MPIQFTCPHCGTSTNVGDQYAGRSGPCAHCGKTITIPSAAVGDFNYANVPPPPRRGMPAWAILLIIVGVGLPVVLGILIALLLPAISAVQEAAKKAACSSNLHQISLAMLNYENANGHFPPAYVADEKGRPMHSWRVLILPYLEEGELYKQYNMNEPWDSPHNRALAAKMPKVYRCPSESVPKSPADVGMTSYLMLVGPGCISTGPTMVKSAELPKGASHTLMVIESAGSGVNWMEPTDCDAVHFPPRSNHLNVVNAAFADGSVRPLRPDELKAFKPNAE